MLAILLCAVAVGHLVMGQSPQVTTSQGTLKGQILRSRDGRDYFSFTRIPYAKPPLGERRFMISEKADKWTGILDATQPTPTCYQKNQYSGGPPIIGQEDCLYLNVFTPNTTGKYPVIFSIHGGGFNSGSVFFFGNAKFFMDEDVVFVAPNYRLGNLGFLSLEDNVMPGNMGLKDQALALEWVYKEISAFGGDPNLITVIGESAGGASSDLICSSPRTNGLIKGCVSQSGNGWTPWAILKPGESRRMVLNLAKAVGCNETGNLLKCLQDKPIELVANITLVKDETTKSGPSPVLEPVNTPGAILTSWPTSASHNYPWIVGVCQDDGMLFTGTYEYNLTSKQNTDDFINTFNNTIITQLDLQNKPKEFLSVWERFFNKGLEPLRAIRNFFTEFLFLYPSLVALNKHPGPTYFYVFNYTGGPQMFVGNNEPIGVGHAAELAYFFEFGEVPGWPKLADIELSKQLVKMWVNFARNQTPSSKDVVQWPQFQGLHFLDIQNSGVTVRNYDQYQEILDFWKTIFPDPASKSSTIQSSLVFMGTLSIFTAFKTIFL
ncbi:juvenile hormone esterase [Halyomorpha halys]|uniref:juvenile hormone esterase n=1 Tax=Halyomorpha halys TaxID=286706 RepID=UPI0006D4DD76|nr:venom carboxylesterase-6 [Halyomorpha halys]